MGLYSDILRILDNPENMSQHGRRAYWAHQIVLMAREDAVQRVEALPAYVNIPYENPSEVQDGDSKDWLHYRAVIAAIKGGSDE